jgi:hypothetical protein
VSAASKAKNVETIIVVKKDQLQRWGAGCRQKGEVKLQRPNINRREKKRYRLGRSMATTKEIPRTSNSPGRACKTVRPITEADRMLNISRVILDSSDPGSAFQVNVGDRVLNM